MSIHYIRVKDVPNGVLSSWLIELSKCAQNEKFDNFKKRVPAQCSWNLDIVLEEVARRLLLLEMEES